MVLPGIVGKCGSRKTFIGFAPANLLCSLSFADALNEETGEGYQRKFSARHSQDFRRYILRPGATTIPLTLNLRPESKEFWRIAEESNGTANLFIQKGKNPVFARVDCQHRLGCMSDVDTPFAYMTFIGLNLREEMQIFSVINGKAKGLSSSLLDFHESQFADDLASEKPQLYIALRLNDHPESPWFKQLDLGGNKYSGLNRRASLRTMQKAVKRFLATSHVLKKHTPDAAYTFLLNFWKAIAELLKEEWQNPRKHFVTKGIGVYALTNLASVLFLEEYREEAGIGEYQFQEVLKPFIAKVNWSHEGHLKGFGGESGAQEAFNFLNELRTSSDQLTANHGK
jgi:DGQHR domain-containing protein